MEKQKKVIVKAPEGCKKYLTAGKEYEAFNVNGDESFMIKNDTGGEEFCLFKGCAHLNGGNWIVVNKKSTSTAFLKQQLDMKDIEIAALKLEALTQTEIAANNKAAYEATNDRLLTLQQHYTSLNEDCIILESKLMKEQAASKVNLENYELESNSNNRLKISLAKIPKWIQWLFGV